MPRPKKHGAETDGPSRPVSFRLSAPEYDAFKARCAAAGLCISDFFREAVLANRTQIIAKAKPLSSPDSLRLLFLVNKSSNNINQLARRANEDHLSGKLDTPTYRQILAQLELIVALFKEVASVD